MIRLLIILQVVLVVLSAALAIGPDGNVQLADDKRDLAIVGIALLFLAAVAEVWKRLYIAHKEREEQNSVRRDWRDL